MAKKTAYTQKTIKELKARGCVVGIVERYNMFAGPHGIRQDLFGFIDLIALNVQESRLIGVQSFGQDYAPHYRKVTGECRERALAWLRCGGEIELWGWRKMKVIKKNGKKGKAEVWTPRVGSITAADFVTGNERVFG